MCNSTHSRGGCRNGCRTILRPAYALVAVVTLSAGTGEAHSQTIYWGSPFLSTIVDSKGDAVAATFQFELGAFDYGFVPSQSNIQQWSANWQVFDSTVYNQDLGYFTSAGQMMEDGSSASAPAFNFSGQDAFLWIRDSTEMIDGSEWQLVRSEDWIFPAATAGCCDNGLPLEWSVSDLNELDVPYWGGQSGVIGAGSYTNTSSSFTLQTHSVGSFSAVPEVSSSLVGIAIMIGLVMRRKRAIPPKQ